MQSFAKRVSDIVYLWSGLEAPNQWLLEGSHNTRIVLPKIYEIPLVGWKPHMSETVTFQESKSKALKGAESASMKSVAFWRQHLELVDPLLLMLLCDAVV